KETIIRFYRRSLAEGLSLVRVSRRLFTTRYLSRMLGKRFQDATKQDVEDLVGKIESKEMSPWTKVDYKKMLKLFYKWLRGTDEPPPEVRWIKCAKNIPPKLLKKDLLTPSEASSIVQAASRVQDKALFSAFYDSGRRPGEIFGLNIGDVEFDTLGAKLRVDGKMGGDIVRICGSAPRVALWVDNHPDRDNMAAPLWVSTDHGKIRRMTYKAARKRLEKAVQIAGLKKRVWYYLFRHSRITAACTKLSYSEMCHLFGWKQGSNMPMFYVHLAGEDRDHAFRKMNGMPLEESQSEDSNYAPQECTRCGRKNSPDAKFCNGCGLALDIKAAFEIDRGKESLSQRMDTIRDELAKSPEVVDVLLKSLRMLKDEKGFSNGDSRRSTRA
ncbi:MAG: tyrosine-type recombinase/integrase, partial [Candidatus Geothermarchaeales archaeon]